MDTARAATIKGCKMETNIIILIGIGVVLLFSIFQTIILLIHTSRKQVYPQSPNLELPKLDFKTQLTSEIAEKARKIDEIKMGVRGLEKDYKALIKEKDELEEQRRSLL